MDNDTKKLDYKTTVKSSENIVAMHLRSALESGRGACFSSESEVVR